MKNKQLQDWLKQFPDDIEIGMEVNNHWTDEEITHASLIQFNDNEGVGEILIFGNTCQAPKKYGGYIREGYASGYNIKGEKYLQSWSLFDGFKNYNE